MGNKTKVVTVPTCCGQRWILSYVSFFGVGVVYAFRANLSVAIVCMVKSVKVNVTAFDNVTTIVPELDCVEESKAASMSNERGELDWDVTTRSTLLASFFYGYITAQIPGGILADRFGGKRVLLVDLFLQSTLTILTPIAARTSVTLVYVIRVLLGILSAMCFPSVHAMWGRWAPPLERSKLTTLCYAGTMFGNIVTFSTSGLLCQYGFDNGWGSIFYVTGGLGIIWCSAWFYLAADTPGRHRRISVVELDYIKGAIEYDTEKRTTKIPWGPILRSPCLWACAAAHACNNWTDYTLLTNIPTFMKEVLKFDIKANGLMSALPYICQMVSSVLAGYIADFVRYRGLLTTTNTRKLLQTLSFAGGGGLLIGTGFCTCEQRTRAVALLSCAMFAMGIGRAGFNVNHIDFAPKYAGLLFAITNMVSSIPGMTAPILAGYLTPNNTAEEWRNVFYVCAGFAAFGCIVFNIFGSGDLQEWAKDTVMEIQIEVDNSDKPELEPKILDNPLDKQSQQVEISNNNEEPNDTIGQVNEGFNNIEEK